jgi:hypothetical protein
LRPVDFNRRSQGVEDGFAEPTTAIVTRWAAAGGIGYRLALSLLAEIVADHSRKPGEVPWAAPRAWHEATLLAKIPSAVDHFLFCGALCGIHNVNHVAIAGIDPFFALTLHVVGERFA